MTWPTHKASAVVLFSGGMDSAYCLHGALSAYQRVYPFWVDYGQKHAGPESEAALRIAQLLGVDLERVSMRLGTQSALNSAAPLASGSDSEGKSYAFVPGRNLHLLMAAAAHAARKNANNIVMGCCADDAGGFPDCRRSFMRAAEAAISAALGREFTIVAPLLDVFKADLATNAPPTLRNVLRESWSCYTPDNGQPCGLCDACLARARAGL